MTDAGRIVRTVLELDEVVADVGVARRANPVRSAELMHPERVEAVQQLRCATRPTCLTMAADAGWRGFTCSSCTAGTPMDESVWRAEVAGLARFGRLIAGLAIAPDVDLPYLMRLGDSPRAPHGGWRAAGDAQGESDGNDPDPDADAHSAGEAP